MEGRAQVESQSKAPKKKRQRKEEARKTCPKKVNQRKRKERAKVTVLFYPFFDKTEEKRGLEQSLC